MSELLRSVEKNIRDKENALSLTCENRTLIPVILWPSGKAHRIKQWFHSTKENTFSTLRLLEGTGR